MNIRKQFIYGFTLVELLIVISIIGILATIVAVSYTGIQNNAIGVSLQSDLSNASDFLRIDQARSSTGSFPDTLALANGGKGIPFSSGTSYPTYVRNNSTLPHTFCLTATKSGQNYFITQEGTPMPGVCPILYLDAGIATSYSGTGTAWNDLSGNGNNGTLNGGVGYNSTNGGYLNFDGVDDNVTFSPISGVPTGNSDRTLSVWMNTSGDGTTDMYPAVWLGSSGYHNVTAIGVRAATHYLAMTFWGDELDSSVVATNGQWFNLVGVYVGATRAAKLYINGKFVIGKTLSADLTTPANIYLSSSPDSRRIKAALNNPRIYNRALTDTEILQNFNNFRDRYGL